jgi:hypothetical protein
MRQLPKQAALILAATLATAALSTEASAGGPRNNCEWNAWNAPGDQPVFDGPADGLFYTGPYRGAFARVTPIDEANCLMECRVRPARWSGWQYYTVRVCRGDHVVRSRARRVDVELK